ncbi:MAG: DUF4865 family protein [Xanthomonas sp.]
MIAMQYRIALPADDDMAGIRRRIAEKGPLLDALPGLRFKAYLVADRGDPLLPARQNLYAPFYLWRDAAAMHAFLAGPAFAALCDAFGRPAVQAWMVGTAWTSAALRTARYATCALQAPLPVLADDTDDTDAPDERVLAAVCGYEPQEWTRLCFRLWRDLPPADGEADRYAVQHLSAPGTIEAAG